MIRVSITPRTLTCMPKRKRPSKRTQPDTASASASAASERKKKPVTASKAVEDCLKGFKCNTEATVTRFQTITVPYEAVEVTTAKEKSSYKQQQREQIIECSKAIGVLTHLVTVYMNHKALMQPDFEHLTSRAYIKQLFNAFANVPQQDQRRVRVNDELVDNPTPRPITQDTHLQDYLRQHLRPHDPAHLRDIKDLLKTNFLDRSIDDVAGTLQQDAKQHLKQNFRPWIEEHMICHLEQHLWFDRDTEHFKKRLEQAANALFQAAVFDDNDLATRKVEDFLMRGRGTNSDELLPETWHAPLRASATMFRQDFTTFRMIPEEYWNTRYESNMHSYNLNCTYLPQDQRELLETYRTIDEPLRAAKAEVLQLVNAVQARLKPAKTRQEVVAQLGSFSAAVPAPTWAVPGATGDLSNAEVTEYKACLRRASQVRNSAWLEREQSGFRSVPKAFTLLPVAKLQSAFINLDGIAVSGLHDLMKRNRGEQLGAAWENRPKSGNNARLWWLSLFDLHTKMIEKRDSNALGSKGKRAVLKTKRKTMRRGVRQLWDQQWFLTDAGLQLEQQNQQRLHSPKLVNTIQTDGVQVKIQLCSKVCEESGTGYGPAIGTTRLAEAGLDHIQGELDVEKHCKGLFRSVKPLSQELRQLLEESDSSTGVFIEAVGVDRGEKKVIAHSRAHVYSNTEAEAFKGSTKSFSCAELKYQSLQKRCTAFQQQRKAENPAFRIAEAGFSSSGASLKSTAGEPLYHAHLYANLTVLSAEYCSMERRQMRFAQDRAMQRTIARMARDLAGGDLDAAALRRDRKLAAGQLKESAAQTANRTAVRAKLCSGKRGRGIGADGEQLQGRSAMRIIFFGDAQFGNGSRGGLPFKKLLKELAARVAVVMTSEWGTSKKCCSCGSVLKQVERSRVFRCPAHENEVSPCSVNFIDRDSVASVSIAKCGIYMLRGQPRPLYLTPPARDASALAAAVADQ